MYLYVYIYIYIHVHIFIYTPMHLHSMQFWLEQTSGSPMVLRREDPAGNLNRGDHAGRPSKDPGSATKGA